MNQKKNSRAAELAERYTGHTKGGWLWHISTKTRKWELCTYDRGMVYILGGARWGMQGTIPLFQRHKPGCDGNCSGCGVMTAATNFTTPDHNGVAFEVNHPDARLMADAAILLEEHITALGRIEELEAKLAAAEEDAGGK